MGKEKKNENEGKKNEKMNLKKKETQVTNTKIKNKCSQDRKKK